MNGTNKELSKHMDREIAIGNDGRRIELGDEAREMMTGVAGIVVSITYWFASCAHIGIKRQGTDKDGKPWELLWFDAPQVTVVKKQARTLELPSTATPAGTRQKTGGPVPNGR